jgi:uncharacterized damage-inducible protein DinB
MSIAKEMLAELNGEAGATKRIFERLPENKLGWKPHPKSLSLGQLALHVARLPAGVSMLAEQDVAEVPRFDDWPEAKSREELLSAFDESLKVATEILSRIDDARAAAPWSFQRNGDPVFTVPRAAMLRSGLLNHSYHHRGELCVYLRLLDVPVPAIYGPSADENPFA